MSTNDKSDTSNTIAQQKKGRKSRPSYAEHKEVLTLLSTEHETPTRIFWIGMSACHTIGDTGRYTTGQVIDDLVDSGHVDRRLEVRRPPVGADVPPQVHLKLAKEVIPVSW